MAVSAGAIEAGRAFVRVFGDSSALDKTLAGVAGKLQSWGKAINSAGSKIFGLGAAIVAPLFASAKAAAETARDMVLLSQRTGISVEELSKLKFAAERSGLSIEDLDHLLGKLHKTVLAAAQGNKEDAIALARLGTSAAELGQLAPIDQLKKLADGLAKVEDVTLRDALAMAVFGRGGREILTFLGEGSGRVEQLMKRAEELGIVMSTKDVKAARAFGQAMAEITAVAKYLSFTIGSAVAPVFADLVKQATPYIKIAVAWIRENTGLIVSALKVGGALLAAGAAMKLFGAATSTALGVIKFMIPGLSPLSLTTLAIRGVVGAASLVVGTFGFLKGAVLALTSPLTLLGLLLTGAAVGVGVMVARSREGSDALGHMAKAWAGIKDAALTAWGGIRDALATGDLAAAANVTWLGIKVGGLEAFAALKAAWVELSSYFQTTWAKTTNYLQNAWLDVKKTFTTQEGLKEGAQRAADLHVTIWKSAFDAIKAVVVSFYEFLQKHMEFFKKLLPEVHFNPLTGTAELRWPMETTPGVSGALGGAGATPPLAEQRRQNDEQLNNRLKEIDQARQAALAGLAPPPTFAGAAAAGGFRTLGGAGLEGGPLEKARRELAMATEDAARAREASAKKVEEAAAGAAGGTAGGLGIGGREGTGTFSAFGAQAIAGETVGGTLRDAVNVLKDILRKEEEVKQAIRDAAVLG